MKQKIISTTTKNLLEEVNKGNFIKILYDRLSKFYALFEDIGNRYKDRNGGYTRIIKIPSSSTQSKIKSFLLILQIIFSDGVNFK